MISTEIPDIKSFTKKLFIDETFDRFLLREAQITTFNTFSIDGTVHPDYFTDEELEEGKIETLSTWKMVRPFCFSLIKGKHLPERFRIVLKYPEADLEGFIRKRGLNVTPDEVGGLFLNILYENRQLSCITGCSFKTFIMDKTLEHEWDDSIKALFKHEEIS